MPEMFKSFFNGFSAAFAPSIAFCNLASGEPQFLLESVFAVGAVVDAGTALARIRLST